MTTPPQRGLPVRVYLPIVVVFGGAFLALMIYLVGVGFGVRGSVFGTGGKATGNVAPQQADAPNAVQGGGPPASVVLTLKTLRDEIASHPKDDVAITQLADMYLTAGKYADAIPLYRRALRVNPRNVAAQDGLQQAQSALAQGRQR